MTKSAHTAWTVTMKTGIDTWSEITVEAHDHIEAAAIATRLIGGTFVSVV